MERALSRLSRDTLAPAGPHRNSTFQTGRSYFVFSEHFLSDPVQHGIHFRSVSSVVYDPAIHFNPSVRFEGHLLGADDQLRWYTVAFEQTCCGCRSLQTSGLFPVPDTGQVDSRADLLN